MPMLPKKEWGYDEGCKAHPIDELLKLYVHINAEAENDPSGWRSYANVSVNLKMEMRKLTLLAIVRDESLVEFNRL